MALSVEIDAAARILSKGAWDGCEGEGVIAGCRFPPCPCRTAAQQILEAAEVEREKRLTAVFGPEVNF